jgi:hypothetical protein
MGIKMNKTKEILDDMRRITMLTGEISSVHEESLKKWPLIAFDEVAGVEIKYDLTKEYTKEVGEGYVIFEIDMPEEKIPKDEDFHTRCEMISQWVRDMFWDEIKVEITTKIKGYTNSHKGNNGLK